MYCTAIQHSLFGEEVRDETVHQLHFLSLALFSAVLQGSFGRFDVEEYNNHPINLYFLYTGGAYYVPYSFLLISNKFCNGREGPEQGH